MCPDYYQTLGVSRKASSIEIKAAYRKLAQKYHPDHNPGDKDATAKFQEINEANEVLSDPDKRKLYDLYGTDWKSFSESEQSSTSDQWQKTPMRGFDHIRTLKLSILQATKGSTFNCTVEGRHVEVQIPPGVKKSSRMRYYERGGPGIYGGPNGDLLVDITVEDDSRWTLIERNIYSTEKVDLFTAVLGGEILVKTVHGPVTVKIKPETPNGAKLRLRGKGYPNYEDIGRRGDFIITVHIYLPTDLDPKEKSMFTRIAAHRKRNKLKPNLK